MRSSENDGPNKRGAGSDVHEEANVYEDEINLIDYFRVLWKRKYFILLGSVLPALIVGLIFFSWPRKYKVTYVYDVSDRSHYDVSDRSHYDVSDRSRYDVSDRSHYDVSDRSCYDVSNWNLNEKNYNVLLGKFYGEKNLNKIVNKLRESDLDGYAELITRVGGEEDLKKFVDFGVLPSYVDLSRVKVTDPAKLEQIRQLKAQLLKLTITGKPKNDILKISLVIRDNLENVIPVYFAGEQLNTGIQQCRAKMADIEENRFNLRLALKTNKAILIKLKNIKADALDKAEGRITLQFDVGSRTEYLPVEYQIQATESKIIQFEEQIVANEKKYSYCDDLLALNEELFAKLNSKAPSYYTIQQFHAFLTDLAGSYKSEELEDYLSSYIKRIENRISASLPVTEEPRLSAISKGTAKKSAIVFAIALMISVFAAFLSEALQGSQVRAS